MTADRVVIYAYSGQIDDLLQKMMSDAVEIILVGPRRVPAKRGVERPQKTTSDIDTIVDQHCVRPRVQWIAYKQEYCTLKGVASQKAYPY